MLSEFLQKIYHTNAPIQNMQILIF